MQALGLQSSDSNDGSENVNWGSSQYEQGSGGRRVEEIDDEDEDNSDDDEPPSSMGSASNDDDDSFADFDNAPDPDLMVTSTTAPAAPVPVATVSSQSQEAEAFFADFDNALDSDLANATAAVNSSNDTEASTNEGGNAEDSPAIDPFAESNPDMVSPPSD